MLNSLFHSRTRIVLTACLLLLASISIGLWLGRDPLRPSQSGPLERLRSELTLREGQLYAAGDEKPFTGLLYENYPLPPDAQLYSKSAPKRVRKLEIEIRDGRPHGRSIGRFENGQVEVEEFFVNGVSHGLRTRWNEQGKKKSEAQIEHGKVSGRYTEWYDNGTKAVEMTLREDQPEGLAEAWHPDGKIKSSTRFAAGKIIDREFFPDAKQTAATSDKTAGP